MLNRAFLRFVYFFLAPGIVAGGVLRAQTVDWPVYNGGPDGDHYSRLTQINRGNVSKLQVAWTFDTGEKGGIQTNPLIVGRTLYAYTPTQKVIALDAATGKLKWKFDSGINGSQPARGLAYWTDGTGRPHLRRGDELPLLPRCRDGQADRQSSARTAASICAKGWRRATTEKQSIALTSPGVVYKDLIIVGGRNPETHPAPPGYIRAFDVRTGKLRWVFHTIPLPGEPGYETWPKDAWKTAGAANNWAGMTLDVERGIVYVPTGSAVMDFYGGDRVGDDLYANSLLALDANTGKLLWHFQGVHHDIWDRDFPSPPALFTLKRDGKTVEALAQTSKQGYLYLFDRLDGQAAVSHSRAPVSGQHGAWRGGCQNPAAARLARALCPPAPDRRHADHAHAGNARLGGEAFPRHAQRRAVCSICGGGPADHRVSRIRRRRGVGRAGGRPGQRHPLRERQ